MGSAGVNSIIIWNLRQYYLIFCCHYFKSLNDEVYKFFHVEKTVFFFSLVVECARDIVSGQDKKKKQSNSGYRSLSLSFSLLL